MDCCRVVCDPDIFLISSASISLCGKRYSLKYLLILLTVLLIVCEVKDLILAFQTFLKYYKIYKRYIQKIKFERHLIPLLD